MKGDQGLEPAANDRAGLIDDVAGRDDEVLDVATEIACADRIQLVRTERLSRVLRPVDPVLGEPEIRVRVMRDARGIA